MSDDPDKDIDLHESEWSTEERSPEEPRKSPWNWYITDWYDVFAMVVVLAIVFTVIR